MSADTMAPHSEERFAARARAVRWARRRPLVVVAAAVAVAGTLSWLLFASSAFAVHRVVVRGADTASAQTIESVASAVLGDSMFTVDTSRLRSRIAAIPAVAHVSVHRAWPRTVRVDVALRKPVAAVREAGEWHLVDRTGTPFATDATRPPHLVRLVVAAPDPGDPATRAALAVWRQLPMAVSKRLVALIAPSPDGVRLRLRHGVVVVWGSPEDTGRKGRALAALLHRHASVYDVSTPGLVTTRG